MAKFERFKEYEKLQDAHLLWQQSERVLDLLRNNPPSDQSQPEDRFLLDWASGKPTSIAPE